MNDTTNDFPAPPLPRAGQQRAWWRAPASASALAFHIARAARAHDGPVLAIARDNHGAHQLESDLRTLLGDDADAAGAALPGLGNPALRPVQPAPGHRLAAPGRAAPPADAQARHRGGAGADAAAAPARRCATSSATRFDVRGRPEARPRCREAPARSAPATATCRRCSTRATSPCAAACSTCIRWARTSRTASSCSTTRSIRSAPSIRRSQRSLDKVDAVQLLPGREVPLDDESPQARDATRCASASTSTRAAARCTRT